MPQKAHEGAISPGMGALQDKDTLISVGSGIRTYGHIGKGQFLFDIFLRHGKINHLDTAIVFIYQVNNSLFCSNAPCFGHFCKGLTNEAP